MDHLPIHQETLNINSHELLVKYVLASTEDGQNCDGSKKELISAANTVSSIYYFRKFPNVEDFIRVHLAKCNDYFLIQWVRNTWLELGAMTSEELSELVINKLTSVDN